MNNVHWTISKTLSWGMDHDWMGGRRLQEVELEADLELKVLGPVDRSFRPLHLAAHIVLGS